MTDILSVLLLCTIPLSCIAILLSCICISIVVGLKNSTHKIEWKTYEPTPDYEKEAEEFSTPILKEENPNKRIKDNPPFNPYPKELEDADEDDFFDEEDPNNISHDFN